jgi:excinuclease ABC subunit B
VVAPFFPSGDQPAAIARCVELLRDEKRKVCCLRGATGTGKTFVVAHVVDALTQEKPRPTLVVVPNKTLAAQVARELRGYLPKKRVELFVSHFSLYVPESFSKGRYVEKRSAIDVDLDALRHRATKALLETDETVIVASVSCLYGLGLPKDYVDARLTLDASKQPNGRDALGLILEKRLLYSECREGGDFVKSGQWAWESGSTHGQTGTRKLIVWPPYERAALELELKPDGAMVSFARRKPAETKTRAETAATTTTTQKSTPEPPETATAPRLTIWPRQHHITPPERLEAATAAIAREAAERAAELRASGDHIEADRLEQRVGADVGLLREIGWCPGAEHYSRHLAGREPGAPPVTLLDYLGFDSSASSSKDQKSIQSGSREWLLVADESHVMLPQLRAMHGGDRSRKLGLVRGGYRLPSALDNRPLNFDEFWARVPKALLVSATPGDTEAAWCASGAFDVAENESSRSGTPGKTSAAVAAKQEEEGVGMVDMVVRPSGVLDPLVTILPRKEQLPALAAAVRRRAARGEASLVCALTKTDCEDLAGYLCLIGGVRADWLHSGLTAKERAVKLQKLQQGELDCLVGAQLLREGLDVPQVSLVIVLDAGVPGFARSSRSLMQMMGRAARNKRGTAILFADEPYTNAMNEAVKEVARRREKQRKHNERYGVTPRTASRGSASASLSLFEVMASEISGDPGGYRRRVSRRSRPREQSSASGR